MNGTTTRPATSRQFDLIRTMLIELGEISPLGVELADLTREVLNSQRAEGRFDYDAASSAITALKGSKAKARAVLALAPISTPVTRKAVEPKARVEIPEVPAGGYALRDPEDENEIKFYQVEVADNGYVTCYSQASDDLHKLHFLPMVAVLKRIVEMGLKESAILYGKELGVCGRCGATLTSKWRLQGIGPVCITKF